MNRIFLLLFGALSFVAHAQVPDYVPTEGLVAWYPLDGDLTNEVNQDESNLLIGGSFVPGQGNDAEGALSFSIDSWAEIHPLIGNTEVLTVHLWINEGTNPPNEIQTALYLGQEGFLGDTTSSLDISRDRINFPGNGRLRSNLNFDFGSVGFDELDGGWVHVVSVFDYGVLSIYRNGLFHQSTTASVSGISINGTSTLGAGHVGSYPEPFNFCHCALDNIGIWNRALTEEEILALYNAEMPVPGCTDPTACNYNAEAASDDGSCVFMPSLELPADTVTFESSLTLEVSSEGSQTYAYLWNTGDTASSIEVIESGLYSVQVIQEESVNRSVRFDANTTELADFSPVTSAFGNEGAIAIDFKIETPEFFEPDLAGSWSIPSYPLFYLDNGAHDPLAIRIGRGCYASEASITLEDDDCGQSNPHVRASWGMDPLHFFDGEWHRMVLSSGSEGHALYVDGNLLPLDYTMGNSSINVWPEDANVFNLGRELNADWDFVGELDNLTVWSYPLDSNQASIFDPCQVTQLTPGLLGFWPFNDSDSSSALDASGNDHHGILNASRTLQPAQTACEPCYAEGTVMVQLLGSSCTDPTACNFDAEATSDDGSCVPSGCTNEAACNFNPDAGCDDESCAFDEDLLDCDAFAFELDSLVVCFGAEVELTAPIANSPGAPSGTAQFIDEFYLDFGGPSSHTLGDQPAGSYQITVSGTWCGGSCWNGHTTDAAYSFNHPYGNGIEPYEGSFTINEYCPSGDNSCELIRPEPDEYNPDHIYTYLFEHPGGEFIFHGLADCCYGDNQAGLNFSVSLLPTSPCALEYAWNNGANEAFIVLEPEASDFVTVTVSSSAEQCTDSLWIEVINQGCSDADACNFNPSDLCTVDCIFPVLGAVDCEEGAETCGEGTIWNSETQTCVPEPVNPTASEISCGPGTYWDDLESLCLPIETCEDDLDGDGVIGVNDLMQLLSSFGTDCTPAVEVNETPVVEDALYVLDHSIFNQPEAFTIAARTAFNGPEATAIVYGQVDGGEMQLSHTNGVLNFAVKASYGNCFTASGWVNAQTELADNNHHHIVATYSRTSGEITLSIDGEVQAIQPVNDGDLADCNIYEASIGSESVQNWNLVEIGFYEFAWSEDQIANYSGCTELANLGFDSPAVLLPVGTSSEEAAQILNSYNSMQIQGSTGVISCD